VSLQAGLSFEQAPPLSLPLRFFLTAPVFLLAAALLIVLAPGALASRWTPEALALTHALTLGFLAMVMLGALTQMLPVVAGSPLPAPRLVASVSHVSLALGTAALMAGFLGGEPAAFGVAVGLLGTGFAVFLAAATISLARAVGGVTVNGIRLALASLVATVLLGVALALLRGGWWAPPAVESAIAAHAGFGLLGWVLLLVIGVAWQVVPMFQLTPPYPPRLSRWLAPVLFALLGLHAVAPGFSATLVRGVDAAIAAAVLGFALATLRLQSRRRRKLADVTLDYWRVGMASLIACVAVWLAAKAVPAWAESDAYPLTLAVLFVAGFAVSVASGMLYKIVPFLAWFHLQSQLQATAGSIPTVKEMIGERPMRWQLRLHVLASGLLVAAVFAPPVATAAGGALALSALLLWANLGAALRRFSRFGGRVS
jgi:hypothetical protein